MLAQYAGQSFRLLAVAGGVLSNVSPAELAGMDQQQAEARCGPLDLLGLQVLSNRLRPSSRQTVTNLRDRCATCTGMPLLLCVLCVCTGVSTDDSRQLAWSVLLCISSSPLGMEPWNTAKAGQ